MEKLDPFDRNKSDLIILNKMFAGNIELKKQNFELETKLRTLPPELKKHERYIMTYLLQLYQLCLVREFNLEDVLIEIDRINSENGKLSYKVDKESFIKALQENQIDFPEE
jgi:hypothetical protein